MLWKHLAPSRSDTTQAPSPFHQEKNIFFELELSVILGGDRWGIANSTALERTERLPADSSVDLVRQALLSPLDLGRDHLPNSNDSGSGLSP